MNLFDLPHARYFCTPPAATVANINAESLSSFHGSLTKRILFLEEGTLPFQVHQVNLLNSIDRWLLYSVSHYRRSVEMLVPVAAPWAHVTLYYSSFFAANAILGIFGGWIGQTHSGNRMVDVAQETPGAQQLRIHRTLRSPHGVTGSHRVFWDYFYDGAASIAAWAPVKLAPALSPANEDFGWQIAARNEVNYDMFHAWKASAHFYNRFRASKGMKSLAGPLQLQLEVTERMVRLALHFARVVSLSTESLSGCGAAGTTLQLRRRLASQPAPSLLKQSEFYRLLEL